MMENRPYGVRRDSSQSNSPRQNQTALNIRLREPFHETKIFSSNPRDGERRRHADEVRPVMGDDSPEAVL
jgi:hypothetical protein